MKRTATNVTAVLIVIISSIINISNGITMDQVNGKLSEFVTSGEESSKITNKVLYFLGKLPKSRECRTIHKQQCQDCVKDPQCSFIYKKNSDADELNNAVGTCFLQLNYWPPEFTQLTLVNEVNNCALSTPLISLFFSILIYFCLYLFDA